ERLGHGRRDRGAADAPAARRHGALPADAVPQRGGAVRKSPLRLVGLTLASLAIVGLSLFTGWVVVTRAVDPGAGAGRRNVIPSGFSLEHFVRVLERSNFPTFLMNSLIVAVVTVVVSGLLALFAAVAVARFRFKGRTKVLMMILIIQMIPIEALVIPL